MRSSEFCKFEESLFALRDGAGAVVAAIVDGGAGGAGGRHIGGRGSVALQQNGRHGVFRFLDEDHFVFRGHIDADEVAQLYLSGGDQVGQREDQIPFDGTLQVTRAITRIGAFLQQELLYAGGAIEDELVGAGGHENALLHHAEFDFEDLGEVLVTQSFEDHGLIDAVHELRCELAASGFDGSALNLVIKIIVDFHGSGREAEATVDQISHLAGAQVRGQDDDALGKIDAAIIAEGERGFIEDAEQQLPERVAGLLDFVEQENRELELFREPLVQCFLGEERVSLAMA